MPVIFGHEIPVKALWIGGGLIAAAVAVMVFLRARAAGAAAQPPPAPPQADTGGYGGGGMTVSAPTDQVASDYQTQLQNAQLTSQNIANQYQQQLLTQQQTQFDFQQKQQNLLAPAYQQEQQSALAVQTHYNQAAANAQVSCPGSASVRTDPSTGQLYCRQKTSGGFLGIPLGDIGRTIQNAIGGVEAAAPTLGYQFAQQAASYYTGQLFPTGTRQQTQQAARPSQATVPFAQHTNPIPSGPAPTPVLNNPMAGIGYEVA